MHDPYTFIDFTSKHFDETTQGDLERVVSILFNNPGSQDSTLRLKAIDILGMRNYAFDSLERFAELSEDDREIYRIANWLEDAEKQRTIFLCNNEINNPFGFVPCRLYSPRKAIVIGFESHGHNDEIYRVFLSNVQIKNLNLRKSFKSFNAIGKKIDEDNSEFPDISLTKSDAYLSKVQACRNLVHPYLAGPGIKISRALAYDYNIEIGQSILIGKY